MLPLQVQFRVCGDHFLAWADRIKREAPEVFDSLLEQSGELMQRIMRDKAPVRTGKLRDSIQIRKGQNAVEVGPNLSAAPYASFVEFGTGPHMIFPAGSRALRFEASGRTVFARYVRHPGTRGWYFIARTREEAYPQIRSLAQELMHLLFEAE
jgi:hypothetical protein